MTAAGDAVLAVARGEIGYAEGPNNSTKYWDWYGGNYGAWCAVFVTWCCEMAGYPMCPHRLLQGLHPREQRDLAIPTRAGRPPRRPSGPSTSSPATSSCSVGRPGCGATASPSAQADRTTAGWPGTTPGSCPSHRTAPATSPRSKATPPACPTTTAARSGNAPTATSARSAAGGAPQLRRDRHPHRTGGRDDRRRLRPRPPRSSTTSSPTSGGHRDGTLDTPRADIGAHSSGLDLDALRGVRRHHPAGRRRATGQ